MTSGDAVAVALLGSLPASVELPAGGGKTWLLTATIREIVARGDRPLVLTHTHAGVHAVRARLHRIGVPGTSVHLATITSFAFELARSYERLGGVAVPDTPNWDHSAVYIAAAARVAANRHISDVLAISFSHLLVDEYQDCTISQHTLIRQLHAAIPNTAVFGDPLQGIFGFSEPIVNWQSDVTAVFPPHPVAFVPHRWRDTNPDLGQWLLEARAQLRPGRTIDLRNARHAGIHFQRSTPNRSELRNAALYSNYPPDETVVVIVPSDRTSVRNTAGRLQGRFSAMEEIGGSFMIAKLNLLVKIEPAGYALWLAELAKECYVGYANLNRPVLDRLGRSQLTSTLRRPGLQRTLAALDEVVRSPSYAALAASMREIRVAGEADLHSREAWNDLAGALESSISESSPDPLAELARRRERVRHGGRPSSRRVVSRTVLIKGLEYDHVIISDLNRISDHCNLYVALTRARRSITVIGASPVITVTETKTSPSPGRATRAR